MITLTIIITILVIIMVSVIILLIIGGGAERLRDIPREALKNAKNDVTAGSSSRDNHMYIWITRHGQTDLNKERRMQGRIDEPLNETGIRQAEIARQLTDNIKFDAVYSSPLVRAVSTAAIIADIDQDDVITDERITEMDFGKYEGCKYIKMGLKMSAFWILPELIPAPTGVESIASLTARTSNFLKELEHKNYNNVLVVCHGATTRALSGYLTNRRSGIMWRPQPRNCEMRIFKSYDGKHKLIKSIKPY